MKNTDYELGFLNGVLETFSRFNNKTNQGHDFRLSSFEKEKDLLKSVENNFKNISESIKLIKIEENHFEYLKNALFQNLFGYQHDSLCLEDPKKAFSLFDKSFQDDFLIDILNVFYEMVEPKNLYYVRIENLKKYYANSYIDIVIESEEGNNYILHFSWYD